MIGFRTCWGLTWLETPVILTAKDSGEPFPIPSPERCVPQFSVAAAGAANINEVPWIDSSVLGKEGLYHPAQPENRIRTLLFVPLLGYDISTACVEQPMSVYRIVHLLPKGWDQRRIRICLLPCSSSTPWWESWLLTLAWCLRRPALPVGGGLCEWQPPSCEVASLLV